MTDRRSFFKSLALLAGATSVSPMVFLPKFEPVKWKRTWIVNPDWIDAPYEVTFQEFAGKWQFFTDVEAVADCRSFWEYYMKFLDPLKK